MIEEQYVSLEAAKLLKEAGFDVPCRGGYHVNRFRYEAPTQALAARWLREVHKLHVFAKRIYDYALDKFSWGYYIQSYNYEYCKNFEIGFDKYEQAIEAGLQETVKLIKK